jgi:hypothetical protein
MPVVAILMELEEQNWNLMKMKRFAMMMRDLMRLLEVMEKLVLMMDEGR